MKERIDKFMKAVREKYLSNCIEWENLHKELRDLCEEDDRKELTKQWYEFHLERKLAKWDDDFMELVINGAEVKEASGVNFGEAPLKREGGSYRHDEVQKKFIDDSEFPWL